MVFPKSYLFGENTPQARRPGALAGEAQQARALGLIEDYRQGLVPLIVPLTLLKHHLNRYPVPEWVLVPSAAWVLVPPSKPKGTDAAQSRVGPSFVDG